MTIYLIRHGETAGNAGRVLQLPDTPLNDRGLAQAEKLAQRLADAGIQRIIASDYMRTQMTASYLCQSTGIEMELSDLWRERHFGDLRGRSVDEVGDVFREDLDPPGGENWQRFNDRVDHAWQWLQQATQETAGNIAVVTHGMVCYSLALRRLQLAEQANPKMRFGNTAVTMIERTPPWQVTLLNCCVHLDSQSAHQAGAGGV